MRASNEALQTQGLLDPKATLNFIEVHSTFLHKLLQLRAVCCQAEVAVLENVMGFASVEDQVMKFFRANLPTRLSQDCFSFNPFVSDSSIPLSSSDSFHAKVQDNFCGTGPVLFQQYVLI